MNIEELRKLLTTDVATVTFTKKDGSKREMICTTLPEYLPGQEASVTDYKLDPDIVTVWDLENDAWRSFKFSTVKSIETDYFNYVVES